MANHPEQIMTNATPGENLVTQEMLREAYAENVARDTDTAARTAEQAAADAATLAEEARAAAEAARAGANNETGQSEANEAERRDFIVTAQEKNDAAEMRVFGAGPNHTFQGDRRVSVKGADGSRRRPQEILRPTQDRAHPEIGIIETLRRGGNGRPAADAEREARIYERGIRHYLGLGLELYQAESLVNAKLEDRAGAETRERQWARHYHGTRPVEQDAEARALLDERVDRLRDEERAREAARVREALLENPFTRGQAAEMAQRDREREGWDREDMIDRARRHQDERASGGTRRPGGPRRPRGERDSGADSDGGPGSDGDPADGGNPGDGPEGANNPERGPNGGWPTKYEPGPTRRDGQPAYPVQLSTRYDVVGDEFPLSWRRRNWAEGLESEAIITVEALDRPGEHEHIYLLEDQAYRIEPDGRGGSRAVPLGPIPEQQTPEGLTPSRARGLRREQTLRPTMARIGGRMRFDHDEPGGRRRFSHDRTGGYRVLSVEGAGEFTDQAYDSQSLQGHVEGGPNRFVIARGLVDRDVRRTGGRPGGVGGPGYRQELFADADPWGEASRIGRALEEDDARAQAGAIEAQRRQERVDAEYPPLLLARYADGIRASQAEYDNGEELNDNQVLEEARRRMRRDLGRRGLRRAQRLEAEGEELEVGQAVPGRVAQAAGRARRAAGRTVQRTSDAAVRSGLAPRVGGDEVMTDPGDTRMLREPRRARDIGRAVMGGLRARAARRRAGRNNGRAPFDEIMDGRGDGRGRGAGDPGEDAE